MYNEPQEFFYIVDLNNAFDLDVESGLSEVSWDEFRENLLTHRIRDTKNGVGFMPVMMKQDDDWATLKTKEGKEHFRGDINIEAITSLVIDLDKPGALEAAEKVFEGYEYLVYSTHNYTPETPWKFRMVIRLHEPILVDNWPVCFEALRSRISLDTQCCNPSRFYYYPSHSKNSNISPRAYHKTGKAITLEDILDLAASPDLIDQVKRTRAINMAPKSRVRSQRHFSGKTIGPYDLLSEHVDTSLQGLLKRHEKSLNDYDMDGSNHNFALSVTSREIYTFGPKINIKDTLAFIFQIAAKSSKPMESGNTADELPLMIMTGMMKYAPEAYEEFEAKTDDIEKWLAAEVRWASLNYAEHQFPDPNRPTPYESLEQDYYTVMRDRHRRFLKEFVNTGDLKELIRKVLHLELRVDKPRYNEIAKALVNYQYGYLSKVKKLPEQRIWTQIQDAIPSLGRVFTGKEMEADPKMLTFARSAFMIEVSSRVPKHVREAHVSHSPSF